MALKKTLGELNSDCIQSLMTTIESQSEKTISTWAINYANDVILPIFNNLCDDNRCSETINAGLRYLNNEMTKKDVREFIKSSQDCARENAKNPVVQACARAISQAVATIHKPTNSLALAFYGSAGIVYNMVGLDKAVDEYNKLAEIEITKMENALKQIAIENESNKVKIDWNC